MHPEPGAINTPNTAARAYRDLEALGVTAGKNGLGVFVTARGPAIARAARERVTLSGFERAAMEALRAGHDPDTLLEALHALARHQGEKR